MSVAIPQDLEVLRRPLLHCPQVAVQPIEDLLDRPLPVVGLGAALENHVPLVMRWRTEQAEQRLLRNLEREKEIV